MNEIGKAQSSKIISEKRNTLQYFVNGGNKEESRILHGLWLSENK